MNISLIKKAAYAVVSLVVISGLFVIADYYGLFGTTIEKTFSFYEIQFRTVDKKSGTPIMNVGVRCFQKNNMNACTRKESKRVGIVSVNIPVPRAVKKTLFFTKAEEIYKTIDPNINIMLIHNSYYKLTRTIAMEDLYSRKITEEIVEMQAIESLEQEVEDEE